MYHSRYSAALCALLMAVFAFPVYATLEARLGGQAYYDTVLDVTWLADANLADTQDFGAAVFADGSIWGSFTDDWIAGMNTANHLGTNTWRLPGMVDFGDDGCNYSVNGTDCGFNPDSSSELASLFYDTLGNAGALDTSGNNNAVFGLTNPGPFSNFQSGRYWIGKNVTATPQNQWYFDMSDGSQNVHLNNTNYFAMALVDGDISAVPIPGALWLFVSGIFGGAAFMRARR